MRTFLYGIMAFSLGCPKKAELPATETIPARAAPTTPEQVQAEFVRNYLLKDVPDSRDGYHCNLIHVGMSGMQVAVCYAEPNAYPFFGGPRLEEESLVVAFNAEPVLYVDKKADGTLDSIVQVNPEDKDDWSEMPLEVLAAEDKEGVKTNYTLALEIVQGVAAEEGYTGEK